MQYAPPNEVPKCLCLDKGPMAHMLCPGGHLTECHFPLTCADATCSHLPRYEGFETDLMAELEEITRSLLSQLAERDCENCQGTGQVEISYEMAVPDFILEAIAQSMPTSAETGTVTTRAAAVCSCISARAAAAS